MTSPAARVAERPGEPARLPRLLVSIPALDEEPTVAEVVRGGPRAIPGGGAVEVVVVDDGSLDRTGERARAAGAAVIRHERPQGVGAAFHSALEGGIDHGGALFAPLDADGQFDPKDLPALIAPVLEGRADFATASRFLDPSLAPEMP